MENYKDDLINVDELAEFLGAGNTTVYGLLQKKKIKAIKIGGKWRIPRICVEEYVLKECGYIE